MALFSRGRGDRGSTGLRGRGFGGRRGTGRGRGNAARYGKRSTFNATRIEKPVDEVSEEGDESSEVDRSELGDLSEASSEDEESISPSVKPYNALLQSLNTNRSRGQPQRKKRKTETESGIDVDTKANEVKELADKYQGDVDHVEEPEEGENLATDEVEDLEESENNEHPHDAFETHFVHPDETKLSNAIQAAKARNWEIHKVTYDSQWKALNQVPANGTMILKGGTQLPRSIGDLQLKNRLEDPAKRLIPELTSPNRNLASVIFNYQDLLFYGRTPQNAEDLRTLLCLHTLNHIFKTRDRVIKNNARLARENGSEDVELRDQGFTRPKVLMLLPTRQACVKAVDTVISLCEPEQQENKKRFQETYAEGEDNFSEDKPEDFRELFGGNDDDMFRLGMKFTRKTVKLFAQFYNSDIIFASPLGLRMAIGTDEARKQDHDFLSSIEVVIIDQADALLMQNWEHIEYIFEHLNLQPKETHGCDFSRVRNWYLDGNSRYLRQTVMISAFNTPELNRLFSQNMLNSSSRVKFGKESYEGTMLDLGIQIKQTFSRFEAPSPFLDPDSRFKFFTTVVMPVLSKHIKKTSGRGQGVLVFIPSYMDFVRIRNYLATSSNTQNISFGSVSEYTSVRDVARARSHFFSGRHSILLYTGRAHHFRRYHLRGVKRIILYALPDNPIFYKEIAGGYLEASSSEGRVDPGEASVRTIFSKWDILRLERIVGTQRCFAMLNAQGGDTFDFL